MNEKKKTGKIVAIVLCLLIVLAVAACAVYYFMFYTNPEQVYKKAINETFDACVDEINNEKSVAKLSKCKVTLDVDWDTDLDIEKEVLDFINKTELGLEVQTDLDAEQVVLNFESSYDKEALLNLDTYIDVKNKEAYFYAKDFFNKFIKVDLEEYMEDLDLDEIADTNQELNKEKVTKLLNLLRNETLSVVKPEYCTKANKVLIANGQEVNATGYELKMNFEQFSNEMLNIAKRLRNNNEFWNLFDKDEIEDLKEQLDDLIEEMEDEIPEMDNDIKNAEISFTIFTKGLFNKFVGNEVVAKDDNNSFVLNMTKETENESSYYVEALGKKVLSGTVKKITNNKSDLAMIFKYDEIGTLKLDLSVVTEENTPIDKANKDNVISIESLSQNDIADMLEKLENSKLYELFGDYLNSYLDDGADELEDNQLSYDLDKVINYTIPEGYTVSRSSDSHVGLDKADTSGAIYLYTTMNTEAEYAEEIKDKYNTYNSDSDYSDVELSNLLSMEVNGKKINVQGLNYTYNGYGELKYSTLYFWTQISDEDILVAEVDGTVNVELQDVQTIFNISEE